MITETWGVRCTAVTAALCLSAVPVRAADPLPAWNDTAPKKAIVAFVESITTPGSPDFVPVAERIATFDNDGTLWSEQPQYFQLAFALDRVKALAPQHPEWKTKEPFASVLQGDMKAVQAGGERALLELVMETHTGNTSEEFERIVKEWIATARHPISKKLYTEMVYQPMLELLAYLRAHEFKTYIVSGGGVEFIRAWSERVYGIPPEQVVGSSVRTRFEMRDGKPAIVRLAELGFIDDKDGKPVAIQHHIGRRPVAAFGNSDGDLQMLQWTAAGAGPRFCLYVHHTDAAREWAYDHPSSIGQLERGLEEAKAKSWTVVSMKDDWRAIYPDAGSAAPAPIAPAPIATAADAGAAKLVGRWSRNEGGYILEIRGQLEGDNLDARYLNPQPIHVSIARWRRKDEKTQVFIELRDRNYPGSVYNLEYDAARDTLTGSYFQAVERSRFPVTFSRQP